VENKTEVTPEAKQEPETPFQQPAAVNISPVQQAQIQVKQIYEKEAEEKHEQGRDRGGQNPEIELSTLPPRPSAAMVNQRLQTNFPARAINRYPVSAASLPSPSAQATNAVTGWLRSVADSFQS